LLLPQAPAWSGWIEYQLSWSPMRSDHLIPLALYKKARRMASEDSARVEQSFLLIVRTRRIVTARCSSAGFSDIPANSRVL
jgi:hypothetical protein